MFRFVVIINLILILIFPPNLFAADDFKKEKELGQKFKNIIRLSLPLIYDPVINSYLNGIIKKLAKTVPGYPFKIEIDVVNKDNLNAFATLAGYMVVYSGLVVAVSSDDELAGVLAHELAHLTQDHVLQNMSKGKIITLAGAAAILAGIFMGKKNPVLGKAMTTGGLAGIKTAMLKYSREEEKEADQLGLIYLQKAGYNPWGMVRIFNKLQKKEWLLGTNVPTYLSNHPGLIQRINYLSARLQKTNLSSKLVKTNQLDLVQTLLAAKYFIPDQGRLYLEKIKPRHLTLGQAILAARLNNFKQAQFYFAQEEQKNHEYVFWRERGIFYYQFGKLKQALLDLQKAYLLEPEDYLTLFYYARALADSNQSKLAATYFATCLKQMPYSAKIREIAGIFYGKQGQMFAAHFNLAYAFLLKHQKNNFSYHLAQAKKLAMTNSQKKQVQDLEKLAKVIHF